MSLHRTAAPAPTTARTGAPVSQRRVQARRTVFWCRTLRGLPSGALAVLAGAVTVLGATLTAAEPAVAATVSGRLTPASGARGCKIIVVQADGSARKAVVTGTGRFSVRGVRLPGASLQLVGPDGTYCGPVVLKAAATKAFTFVKGRSDLRLGPVALKRTHAVVVSMPRGRYQTTAPMTARARRGVPIGAGKLGRVATGTPAGYRGPGGDLDQDGIVGAFDIDDNGNVMLDNVDRSGRGSTRPPAGRAVAVLAPAVRALREDPGPQPPTPSPDASAEFRMFSNFKLCDQTSINANISGIDDVEALIERHLPHTLTLATEVIGGGPSLLDGLGNSYCMPHQVGGVTYPQVNFTQATYLGSRLNLTIAPGGVDAQIAPGALPAQIGAGDAFLQTSPEGVNYAGTLNFVFNSAPALVAYRFDTDPQPTALLYRPDGVADVGMAPHSRLVVPHGAKEVTLTFWRPQRQAGPGEAGDSDGWVDIGGLTYVVDIPNAAKAPDGTLLPGSHGAAQGAYVAAQSNGSPLSVDPNVRGIVDPAPDAPSNPANKVSITVSLPACFSEWASFGPGTTFDFDIQAVSLYGDNAARKVYFVLQ